MCSLHDPPTIVPAPLKQINLFPCVLSDIADPDLTGRVDGSFRRQSRQPAVRAHPGREALEPF